MSNKRTFFLLSSLLILTMIAGCAGMGGSSQPEENSEPVIEEIDESIISASGKVVASKYANLAFMVGAQEFILNVKVGDAVKDGDRLAVLADDMLPQNIVLAEADIVGARQALSDLLQSEAPKFSAEKALVLAQQAVEDAKEEVESKTSDRADADVINKIRAQIDIAKDDLETAEEDYEDVADRDDGDVFKAQATVTLANARRRVDDLQDQLDWYLDTNDPLEIAEAEAALYLAEATMADAQREYDRLKEGPDPDEVAAAEARVKAYESVIDQKYLIAPFDGTIVEVYSQTGETVAPNVPVALLADLSTLVVQTTDLSEVDVAKIEVGDKVRVTFDALGTTVVPGKVAKIALKNSSGSGVYYAVDILLDETPEELRWGMSAFIEILTADENT
ncbi:MAG TPA: HlyD family efflux transporter periplasmic adaptor subunit [Anaerolineaceae bacterium]|nr:HlyD family efflux transporter periplasmic adaptor subunit [Anaerolineaceae bacterium]